MSDTTQSARVKAAVRRLHRAGEHDLADDLDDGDLTVAGVVKVLRRRDPMEPGAAQLADELADLPPDPKPAAAGDPDTPPASTDDPPAADPPEATAVVEEPEAPKPPEPGVEVEEPEPVEEPKPSGDPPKDDHWYVRTKRDK